MKKRSTTTPDNNEIHQQFDQTLESNTRHLQQLFDEMASGFALHEIICDKRGKPVDYRFLEINPAFERLTGLVAMDIRGKRVLEALPETEPFWIETYGRVALTGHPARFENYSQALDKTFSVIAYCPQHGQFAVLFEDITERKQAEKKLRASESRYSALVETAQDLIWQCDAEGRYTYLNPAWEEVFGYKLEEMLGKRFVDFQTPEYAKKDTQEFKRLLQGDILKGLETVHLGKDGGEIHLVFNAKQLLDAEGKPAGSQGTAYDITDRKQAEEKLSQTLELLTNLARLVPGVIYQYRLYPDGSSAFPYSSPGIYTIYEVTPEQVREDATPVFERLHPEDADRVSNLITESARTLQDFYCEFRVILPEQGLRWRWSQAHPERTADGGTLWHGIIQDITERKQAEEALQKSQNLLNATGQVAQVGGWEIDLSGNTMAWTDETYKIHELSPGSQPDVASAINFYHPDDRERVASAVEQATETGQPFDFEARLITMSGNQIWVRSSGQSILKQGKLTGVRGSIQNITDRKNAEEAVKTERNFALQIMNSMGQGLSVTDGQGYFEYVNPAYASMIGYDPKDLLGKTPEGFTVPASLATLKEAVSTWRLGETSTYEIELKHCDGHTVPVMITGVPRWKAGEINGAIAVITDLTERREAEKLLRESEERLRLSTELANVAVWEFSFLSNSMSRSKNHDQLYGLEWQTEWKFETFLEATHPEDREYSKEVIQRSAAIGGPDEYQFDFRVVYLDGSVHWLSVIGQVFERDPEGKGITVRGSLIEITDRKQAEEALQESERRYRERATELETIMDIAPVALWMAQDPSCHVITGNRTANELHRINPDQNPSMTPVEGQKSNPKQMRILHNGVEITPSELPLQVCASQGIEIRDFESQIEFDDGTVVHEIGYAKPLFDENGQPRGAIGAFMDITWLKQIEEELRHRAEELDVLQKTVFDITAAQTLPGLLESIVERACQLVGASGGGLYLTDSLKKEVRCDVSYNTPVNYVGIVIKYGDGVSGRVAQTGEALYIEDYKNWSGRAPSFDVDRAFSTVLGVPLLWGGQVNGVIDVVHYEDGKTFTQEDMDLLNIFAGHAAIAIENSRLLEASQAGEAQVRSLSTRLADAEENERRRIARELHDQVGQSLSALSINMNIMHSQVPEFLPGFKRRLDDSLMLIDQTTDHIRHLMSELRPAVLDDYGLKAALDWAVGSIAKRTNLKLLVEGECNRFPPRVEIALFRIAQEALGNVSRHAHARNVKILLTQDGPEMSMSVTDDGVGFDPSSVEATEKSGWGLRLMAERAESISASLQVESTPGKGTCITAKYHDDNSTGG